MPRKKIIHLITGLDVGGTEKQLLTILPYLQKYHDNLVCCIKGHGIVGDQLEKAGVPVHYLNFSGLFIFSAIKNFYKIVREYDPEIMVTYLIHADLIGRLLGRLFGIKKIVCSKRGSLLQWEWLSFFDRLTRMLVTHYLVQTEVAKKLWESKLNVSEKKLTIIPNGIDISRFRTRIDANKIKNCIGISDHSLVISCISKLRRSKGHEILLEAFDNFYRKNPGAVLLLTGDGENEMKLKRIALGYASKNNILFLGYRKEIADVLSISDIFVLPTEKEGMSNSIIEAMTIGTPVITTNIAENMELLQNEWSGLLFQTGNTTSLEKAIERLANDAALRKKLSKNAQKRVENFLDIHIVVGRLAEFYSNI